MAEANLKRYVGTLLAFFVISSFLEIPNELFMNSCVCSLLG